MGKFDVQLAWCRERLAIAVEDLKEFEAGRRQWTGPDGVQEITGELMERAKRDTVFFETLITAYEKHNAKGT